MNHANAFYQNSAFPNGFDQQKDLSAGFDPSLAFNGVNPSSLEFGGFQQQQHNGQFPNQRVPDPSAAARQQSPAVQPGQFPVNAVVPAKRPHVGDESVVSPSPRPQSGTLSGSRSQTPQSASFQPPYSQQPTTQPFQGVPSPFQQYPQQSTPSPMMNQQFRQNPNPQMMQGTPPSSAPYRGGVGQQTPAMQNPYITGQQFNPAAMSSAGQQPGMPNAYAGPQGMGQQQQGTPGPNAHRLYQMQLIQAQQRAQQEINSAQQAGQHSGQAQGGQGMPPQNPYGTPVNPGMQRPMMPPNQQQMQGARNQPEQLVRSLAKFLQDRGKQLNMNPTICGQPIHYFRLFHILMSVFEGNAPTAEPERWQAVARQMSLPPDRLGQAAQELRTLYDQNVAEYFANFIMMRKKHNQMQQQQRQMMAQQGGQTPNQAPQGPQPQQGQQQQQQQPQPQVPTPGPQFNQQGPNRHAQTFPQTVDNSNAAVQAGNITPTKPRPPSHGQTQSVDQTARPALFPGVPDVAAAGATDDSKMPPSQRPLSPTYHPVERTLTTCGGLELGPLAKLGDVIAAGKASFPILGELGVVDLRSLTMSIRSGFHNEMKYALDQVGLISREGVILRECEDLLEVLLDAAEEQLDVLLPGGGDACENLDIPNFELLAKATRLDLGCLQKKDVIVGQDTYEQEKAVNRLLAITTILRNLSFTDGNPEIISHAPIVKFVTHAIRLLGSKHEPLRASKNSHELMKDIAVLLSNTAQFLSLGNFDEASAFLQFLAAFTPAGSVFSDKAGRVRFVRYEPAKHHYLPCAIDALAKLLARDEPNRSLFKSVIASEGSPVSKRNNGAGTLLDRAFALAIAPTPSRVQERTAQPAAAGVLVKIADVRNPFFSQGMLAAEILSSLIPPLDASRVATAWLNAEDGWASCLLHVVLLLARADAVSGPEHAAHAHGQYMVDGSHLRFSIITSRAMAMLHRLAERADGRARSSSGPRGSSGVRGATNSNSNAKEGTASRFGWVHGLATFDDALVDAMQSAFVDAGTLRLMVEFSRMVE